MFEAWDYNMTAEDTVSSLYMRWFWENKNSVFAYITKGERLSYGYHWVDFNSRFIKAVYEDGEDSIYQEICRGYDESYTGKNPCAYNQAKSLVSMYNLQVSKISPNEADWTWSKIASNEYINLPWSKIPGPLKWFFHRSVPAEGGNGTVSMTKVRD